MTNIRGENFFVTINGERIGPMQSIEVNALEPEQRERDHAYIMGTINDIYSTANMREMVSRVRDTPALVIGENNMSVEFIHGDEIDKVFKSVRMGPPQTNRQAARFLEKE